jgi:hypothetical protein
VLSTVKTVLATVCLPLWWNWQSHNATGEIQTHQPVPYGHQPSPGKFNVCKKEKTETKKIRKEEKKAL